MSTSTILSGKYRLCREIGRGRCSIVYLAVHQELEEYRAIKRIPKKSVEYRQFLREAYLLRDLRHPGIPIVYDLAEDETYSYLIEEYLSGETLQAVVSVQGPLSKAMVLQYGVQLCRLVHFLHSRKTPILFLDLHPKNLLICDGVLKLIDFGQAIAVSEAQGLTKRYGTVGYAAPEQFTGESLDIRTDLYAIGAVLYFMCTGMSPGPLPTYSSQSFDAALIRILRRLLTPSKEERYSSAQLLEQELKGNGKTGAGGEPAALSLTIAVAAVRPGAGATHAAIGLCNYVISGNTSLYDTLYYEEKNLSGDVRRMADWFGINPDKDGRMRIKGLKFLPQYGPAAHFEACGGDIVIQDYGSSWPAIPLHQADAVLLICGSRWWEQEAVNAAFEALESHPGLVLIYNHISRQKILLPSKAKKARCFPMPHFPDPFAINSPTASFYQKVIKTALHGRKEYEPLCFGDSVCTRIRKRLLGRESEQLEL